MTDDIIEVAEPAVRVRGWHIDRGISPAFLLSVFVMLAGVASQSYVAITWAISTTSSIEEVKREIGRQALSIEQGDKRILDRGDDRYREIIARIVVLERDRSAVSERVARVETQFQWLVDAVGRMERKIDLIRR